MIGKKIFLCCGLIFSLGITACSSGSSTDNPPGPGGDDDPPVADEYQVSKEYWTENITLGGYFGVKNNLTFNTVITDNEGEVSTGYLYNANGKLHLFVKENAEFKIWAWGGEYGTGQWVEIKSINKETKEFVFSLYDNCGGFKIVRLNPNNMPADIYVWDETTIAWNQTGNLTPSLDNVGSIIPFSF